MKKEFKNIQELRNYPGKWEKAHIIIKEESLPGYNETERTYEISSDNNYFGDSSLISQALYGNCLDGKDIGVRLDWYLYEEWEEEKVIIIK